MKGLVLHLETMILDLFRGKSSNGNDTESCMCDNSKNFIVNEDRAAFSSYAEQSGLPTIENWPNDTNSIVTPSQRATEIKYDLPENNTLDFHSLPMNGDIVRFTGPNFEGKLVSRMRDVPLHPCKDSRMTNAEYFKGRSRQYAWTVQGRFKRRIRFDQVVTGQEFGRPFRNTPSSTMVKRGLDMLKHKLPETFEWYVMCLLSSNSSFNLSIFSFYSAICFVKSHDLNTHSLLDAKAFVSTGQKM